MDTKGMPTLTRRLHSALGHPTDEWLRRLVAVEPDDARDELLSLSLIHDLYLAPWTKVGSRARWQHHPTVASLKQRAESNFLSSLKADTPVAGSPPPPVGSAEVRRIARRDRVAPIYSWVALDANREELISFLALEGGPDDGFDDLVACCQVGLVGEPKLEMARNYWDEMGNGDALQVHRSLHEDLTCALALPRIPRETLPLTALRRTLLTSTLATNRSLQPELIGVLGMIELQAGPRCRQVVRGLERLDRTSGALPFYEVHAAIDPRHGKAWLDNVIEPLSQNVQFSEGIVRGARWRSEVDHDFFATLWEMFVDVSEPNVA